MVIKTYTINEHNIFSFKIRTFQSYFKMKPLRFVVSTCNIQFDRNGKNKSLIANIKNNWIIKHFKFTSDKNNARKII